LTGKYKKKHRFECHQCIKFMLIHAMTDRGIRDERTHREVVWRRNQGKNNQMQEEMEENESC
jgi:hypothetical protein